jgi:DNA-directed RNA polymerase subunit M/transcription elongation factor TFIIS
MNLGMNCPRCGGLLVDDNHNNGHMKCSMCGRWPENAQPLDLISRDSECELSEEDRLRKLFGLIGGETKWKWKA